MIPAYKEPNNKMSINSYEHGVEGYKKRKAAHIKKMALKRAFESFKKENKAKNAEELELHYLMLISCFDNKLQDMPLKEKN